MSINRYGAGFNYSTSALTQQLQALYNNYYVVFGEQRDFSNDMNFYEFIDELNQRKFKPEFKIPVDDINLPTELIFLQNTFFHSLAESQNCVVWEFENPSKQHCVLRIGGDGLEEGGARLNCPLILPSLNVFELGSYRTEIVPCVKIISAPFEELQQFQRRLEILPAIFSPEQMRQFHESSSAKSLDYNGANRFHFERIINGLLEGTPWVAMDFHDIGMLPSGLIVFADPGHIELREGAVDPKLGSPEYQAALSKMYENQTAMKLPKELSWVRRDEKGVFHSIVREYYFPKPGGQNPAASLTA